MDIKFAKRIGKLGSEGAFQVMARAKELEAQGRDIIHLEIGEPDFDTPEHIKEAAMRALREGYTHYTPSAGMTPVREAVADYLARTRHIPIRADQVIIVPGSKNILMFALLALVEPGDEVIYPDPGYPIYESLARFIGAKLRPIRLREENGFRLDLDELRSMLNARTRLVILNSPHNPCGSVLGKGDVEAIASAVLPTRAFVLSDEIYSRILYQGEHYSIAAVPGMQERTIIMDGLSKTYAMTGWRIGFGAMPAPLVEKMAQLMVNSNSCAAAFSQMATVAALTGPQDAVDRMVAEFRERQKLIVNLLNSLDGVTCLAPGGAFYVFPNVSQVTDDVNALASSLLEQFGLACLAGTAFGPAGAGYLRFSYANSQANIRKGINRLREALATLPALAAR